MAALKMLDPEAHDPKWTGAERDFSSVACVASFFPTDPPSIANMMGWGCWGPEH
jgi:hypothetical protein